MAKTEIELINGKRLNDTAARAAAEKNAEAIAELKKNQDSGGNANQGGGMSTTAVNLLIEILENAMYSTNVSGKIASLKESLASGGGSGGGSGTETPDEPDEPTVTDEITISDGVMTIVSVGSAITVSDGAMTIA